MSSKNKHEFPRYATIEKSVGETPLVTAERLRESLGIPASVPLAYAGRLDPMASGKLLILIGDECKKQKAYHSFDKEYRVEILLGVSSDTGDVLGLIKAHSLPPYSEHTLSAGVQTTVGHSALPYPHFSSKTVHGKPLHVWALEKRLHEIEIPTQESVVYRAKIEGIRLVSRKEILDTVRKKIETIPPVTEERKALGADFRRDEVRASWSAFEALCPDSLPIITVTFTVSSGTYMRSLAGVIGTALGTGGLAYSIHRTIIGNYRPLWRTYGVWTKRF